MILIIKWPFPSYARWSRGFCSIKLYVENSVSLSNPFLLAVYNYCLHDSMRQWVSQSNYILQEKNSSFLLTNALPDHFGGGGKTLSFCVGVMVNNHSFPQN